MRTRSGSRELRNPLEREAILSEGGLVTPEHLSFTSSDAPQSAPSGRKPESAPPNPASDTRELHVLERATIERALQDARLKNARAAKMLGLTRMQLYVRLRQHGLG